jgi:hypothetical protein
VLFHKKNNILLFFSYKIGEKAKNLTQTQLEICLYIEILPHRNIHSELGGSREEQTLGPSKRILTIVLFRASKMFIKLSSRNNNSCEDDNLLQYYFGQFGALAQFIKFLAPLTRIVDLFKKTLHLLILFFNLDYYI